MGEILSASPLQFGYDQEKGVRVRRWVEVLLVTILALGITFSVQVEAEAAVKQCPTSVNMVAPLPVFNLVNSATLDANPFPRVPDKVLSDLLVDYLQQPSWMQFTQQQRKPLACAKCGIQFIRRCDCMAVPRSGQLGLAFFAPLSRSFHSFSPPDLIMRL